MPLKAFHCPGDRWTWRTIEDCRKCENVCFGCIEVVEWLWFNNFNQPPHYHDDPMVISVTEALGCLRKAWFAKKHDYAESPKALRARTSGTMWHESMENVPITPTDGERMHFSEYPMDPVTLSHGYTLRGTVDRITPDAIKDYKTVDNPTKTMRYPERIMDDGSKRCVYAEQLSAYAEALEHDVRLQVVQLGRRDAATHDVPRVDGALEFVKERAEKLIVALESDDVSSLDPDGMDIRFFRATACNSCPFVLECGVEV